jgi:hypothetical protein
MNIDQFWNLIGASRSGFRPDHADGNMERQIEAVRELLSKIPANEVREFDDQMHSLLIEAYTWDLWGAAELVGGGWCSDDSFTDFRSWLISMGRNTFEEALVDADSLAGPAFLPGVEDVFFEQFQFVAGDVFEEMTGQEIEDYTESYPDHPRGSKWWRTVDDLRERYPRIRDGLKKERTGSVTDDSCKF